MSGKELQNIVKNSPLKATELIEKSGIPEQTFYALYRKEEVPEHYLKKLSDAGLKLPINVVNGSHQESDPKNNIDYLKAENFWLKQQIELLERFNKTVVNTNETLNLMVTSKLTKSK